MVSSRGACLDACALLTSTSTFPNASTAAATILSALASSEMSAFTNRTVLLPSSASSAEPEASSMSTDNTFAPSLVNARTMPRPIPPAPPVTIATLPASLMSHSSSVVFRPVRSGASRQSMASAGFSSSATLYAEYVSYLPRPVK